MKKTLGASILSAAVFTFGFAQSGQVKFVGKADTIYNGTKLVLYNNATKDRDSALIKDGHFEISVDFKEPTRYFFYSEYEAKKKHGYTPFGVLVVKPSQITMKVNMDSMPATTVSGAPENDLYNIYAKESSDASKKLMDKLAEKYGKEMVSHPDPKSEKIQRTGG